MKPKKSPEKRSLRVHPATRKLWIFLILGVATLVLGIAIVGLYFNVQTVTSSSALTEILPSYIAGLGITVCGALNILLFWRRHIVLVFFEVLLCVGAGSVSAVVAILTGTHILQPIISLESCSYDNVKSICACFSSYKRDFLLLENSDTEKTIYTFERTEDCDRVQHFLPILLYAQCGLFTAVFVLCVICTVLAFLALRVERLSLATIQEETYEEIFTVSGSSCSDLHSDFEDDTSPRTLSVTNSTGNGVNPSVNTGPNSVSKKKNGSIYAQPIGILKNAEKTELRTFPESTNQLIRSKSCDSIDEIYAQSSKTLDGSVCPEKGKSKLKEHRRRERRAVTLHNLDTKQLMSVLSLHMRYLEETRTLQAHGKLNADVEKLPTELKRRAITPQPYHLRASATNTLPKTIRSHTPQPPRKKMLSDEYEDFYRLAQLNGYQTVNEAKPSGYRMSGKDSKENFRNHSVSPASVTSTSSSEKQCSRKGSKKNNVKNKNMGTSQSLPGYRREEPPNREQAVGQSMNEDDDSDIPQRPKSRPSVQNYFLPPQPIRRSKSVTPPQPAQPIHRQSADKGQLPCQPKKRHGEEPKSSLPPEPVHRNSAFEVVGHSGRYTTNPLFGREVMSHDTVFQTPGDNLCEQAIRENFSLYSSPFILHNNKMPYVKPNYALASVKYTPEPPPPYAPPPSYADFMSLSQDGGSSQSDTLDEDSLYESCPLDKHNNNNQPKSDVSERQRLQKLQLQNMYRIGGNVDKKRSENTTSSTSDDDVFVSEHPLGNRGVASPVYSHVSKKRHNGNTPLPLPPRNEISYVYNANHFQDATYHNIYANYANNQPHVIPQPVHHYPHVNNHSLWTSHNYEEIDDFDMHTGYEDSSSSCGMSSQASLLPREQNIQIRKDHCLPGNGMNLENNDPEVLETMI